MLQVRDLVKGYGEQSIFEDVSFLMNPGERLALVGRNGYGKTTLFRLLIGEEHPDSGELSMPKGYRVAQLSQHLKFTEATILDEVKLALGDRIETESYKAEAALMGLGFALDEFSRPPSRFSGGYQIRLNLAKVLISEPNLLLLDEPTNYLDIVSVRWLRGFLRSWPNELIVISHDREFLNSISTHSMVIHRQQVRRVEGSIEKLFEQIAIEEEVYEKTRLNDEKKRKQEERFIERFRYKASKAKAVQSRIKALDRRGRLEALANEKSLAFSFASAPFHASTMLTVEDLSFAFPGGPPLITNLSFRIEDGDRIAVIGKNGKGKTTLLNCLADELPWTAGTRRENPNVVMSYFGQTNINRLDPAKTIEEEIFDAHPDPTNSAVRGICGLMMFDGDLAYKKVDVLSGGERSRVLLGKLLVSPTNLLLLDEPTNHLDMESVESLLDAIDEFPGAVVIVTHSEQILERIADKLIVFDGGRSFVFEGGYRDFLDRVGWQSESDDASTRSAPKGNKKELRRQRAEVVAERSRVVGPLKKRADALEERIMALEADVESLHQQMLQAATAGDNVGLPELAKETKEKQAAIHASFEELEQVSEDLERQSAEYDARMAELE